MMPQLSNETDIRLPLSFIIFSIVALVASQVILLFNGHVVIDGSFRTFPLLSAAHLLILGWALMVAMGAMYQLVPVAFLTPIWSEKFGFVQFWITAIGFGGFGITLSFSPTLSIFTGSLAVTGIVLFLVQMFMTINKQAKKNILTVFVGSALVCLLLTITLGILLIVNLGAGISNLNHLAVLKSHILLGIAGWFTFLIFGFSYKMVPMFSLAHGFSMKPARWVYIMYGMGLIVTISSFITEKNILLQTGMSILFAGFALFSYHILTIIKVRLKKKLDKPFTFSLVAIGFGFVIHFFGMILSFLPEYYDMYGVLIFLYLLLWIANSILGYLYKIIPFLWWTHRYSKLIGKRDVPTLKQMIDEKLAIPIFSGFVAGCLIVVLSIAFGQLLIFSIGQSLVLASTLFFSYSIMKVLFK
ncbi:hypothetical protein E1I69_15875 [Bacillus timonensis]|uniref:Uncharacterized protein n=1 Tax=Bacillus timonensis TaxID=1033734 RepID=A0A4S3PPK5_9BACI|nr:hypothetical protein [Bacillus timonensis]THE11224.1 hypothetical protein E1I69_15875 [Bacillus timonensis]